MPERKVYTEYDPLTNSRIEYWHDSDQRKLFTHVVSEMEEVEKYAAEKRSLESKGKLPKFQNVLKGGIKSIGILPAWINWAHPEFQYDIKALKKFLSLHPKFKTTNAQL